VELLINGAQLAFHGLGRDEQGLCDLAIAHSTGGLTRNSGLARRQRVDAKGGAPSRSEPERTQLLLGAGSETVGSAAMRQVEAQTQRGLRGAALPAAPKGSAELDQRPAKLEWCILAL
jgi:hypothetical protein